MADTLLPAPEAPECSGLVGYFLGHRMEPRFENSEVRPVWTDPRMTNYEGPADLWEKRSHYVGEVCTRCGHSVWAWDQDAREDADAPAGPVN